MPEIANLYLRHSFSAAHFLPFYKGPCQRMHGHNFLVEVWMTGAVDPVSGMVIDFREVRDIIDYLDHTTLNSQLPSKFQPPTAENIAKYLLGTILFATKIRVWESDHSYAEVQRSLLHEYAKLIPAERERLLQGSWALTDDERYEKLKQEATAKTVADLEVEMKMEEVGKEGVMGRVIRRSWIDDDV